jgi:asparagine synthase (glutamine-hydrolysing)
MVFENGRMQLASFWRPPAAADAHPAPAAEAADELRTLLGDAVAERLASGTTSVWMSGGWDSTAVFAAGESILPPGMRRNLRPVSVSHPVGDPGREDDLIAQVAERWDADVHWIQSDDVPLLEGIEERAAASDEPPAHLYELWNRELAKGTRAVGARVALDGSGGDQLFQVSDIALADLLLRGRVMEFARHGRRRPWRQMLRAGVLPALPRALLDLGSFVTRGRIPRHYLERPLTEWVRRDFVKRHALVRRDLSVLRRVRGATPAQRESALYLTLPVWSYGASYMRGALLQEGVEVRSPLLDLRVIDFALRRPISERAGAAGAKALLRQAMRTLLPAEVLAARAHRTGMTMGFSHSRMRAAYPALVARLFSEPLRLAEHGIVEPGALRAAAERFCAGSADDFLRVNLFHTMKVEFWLRGLERNGAAGRNSTSVAKPVLTVTSAA